ncbi:MAG: formylglycine-generating enzyme family protein [Spartobacteria bacterium]|nr:formylglycine-generating enzyme family protein [Spartobacteria bacterium]
MMIDYRGAMFVLVGMALAVSCTCGQELEIAEFSIADGTLGWSNAAATGMTYQIQWRNKLDMDAEAWQTNYSTLDPGPITSVYMEVDIPFFYRVVNVSNRWHYPPVQSTNDLILTNATSISMNTLLSVFNAGPDAWSFRSTGGGNLSLLYTNDNATMRRDYLEYLVTDNGLTVTGRIELFRNQPPTANPITFGVTGRTPVSVNVIDLNTDPDGDDFGCTGLSDSSNSAVSLNFPATVGHSTMIYLANSDFYGVDTFMYTMSDEYGASSSGWVTVTVDYSNRPPTASNLWIMTTENTPTNIDVHAMNSDPNPEDTYGCTWYAQPADGIVSGAVPNSVGDEVLVYSPASNFYGTNAFSYVMSDDAGVSATGTITVAVEGGLLPAVASNDLAFASSSSTVLISVLTNDINPYVGYGRTLQVVSISSTAYLHGVVAVTNNAQQVAYTANPGFRGMDSFTYVLAYGDGIPLSTATVEVAVDGLYAVIDVSSGATSSVYTLSYTNVLEGGLTNDIYKTDKIVFRAMSAGAFMMGSPTTEIGHVSSGDLEETLHLEVITSSFYAAVYEITQGQWLNVVTNNPSTHSNMYHPVTDVSLVPVRGLPTGVPVTNSFIGLLRERTGMTGIDVPTEPEWEYICRAGTTNAYNNNLSCLISGAGIDTNLEPLAWYNGNNTWTEHKVGEKLPNRWGLYDMHGNVVEWTRTASQPSSKYIRRGGYYKGFAEWTRSACRVAAYYYTTSDYAGCRLLIYP